MTVPQPEALLIAEQLSGLSSRFKTPSHERGVCNAAIEELRRQHTEIEALKAAGAGVPAGWVMVPKEILDRFPEINPSNYDHDDACALNDWGVEVVLSAAPTQPTTRAGFYAADMATAAAEAFEKGREAGLAEAEKDAARYRWLRDVDNNFEQNVIHSFSKHWDEMIDAAIAAQRGESDASP
jgi:hypothetical protein